MGNVRNAWCSRCPALAVLLLALLGALVVTPSIFAARGETAHVSPALGIHDVLQKYTDQLSKTPDLYVAQLTGEIRSFLGRRSFTGVVTSSEDGVSTETVGAPWYLPENFSGDLVDVSGDLEHFDLSLKGIEEDHKGLGRAYHVAGVRKADLTTGAARAEFWIRESNWRIVRFDLEYGWGTVDVDLSYGYVGDYLMLSTMVARVHPLGVELHLAYDDYRFGG